MSRGKGEVGRWIKTRLQPGQVAIDVGAWGGAETRIMADRVGSDGRVYAIDPIDDAAHTLATIVGTHPYVTWMKAIAGGQCGTAQLHPGEKGQSSLHRKLVPDPQPAQDVPTITLDSLHEPTTALVKIDAQGSEGAVLDGAQALLRTCPCWIVELWPNGLHVAGTSAEILIQRLRDAGLTVRWGEGDIMQDENLQGWLAHCGDISHVNILAERA